MTKDEILRYINISTWRQVCVYREAFEDCASAVMSVYIVKSLKKKYDIEVVFDGSSRVEDEGGWTWISSYDELDQLIKDLEVFQKLKLECWTNFTKEDIVEKYSLSYSFEDYKSFLERTEKGKTKLPKNIKFTLQ